jgi:hypothetical protein
MARVFVLTGARKGKTITLNYRYQFIDGAMIIQDDEDAAKMRPIVVDFYQCAELSLEDFESAIARKNESK